MPETATTEISNGLFGPEKNDEKETLIPYTISIWTNNEEQRATTYETDPKHANILIIEVGMQTTNEFTTPIIKPKSKEQALDQKNEEPLAPNETTQCKSLVVR